MDRLFVINGKFLRVPSTGVHRVAHELANGLAALSAEGHPEVAGMRFELWTPHDGVERARDIALPLKVIGPLTNIPWEQLTLPLRQQEATLVNLCNIGPMLSRRAVTMIHDVQVHLSPQSYSRGFRAWYHFVQPRFARRHRRILTVSHFSADEIARVGLAPANKIGVIHNGADHVARVEADDTILERLRLRHGRYVLALASTQAHKNIRVLLEAADRLAASGLKLVLVGGTNADAFAAAGLRLAPNVRLTGRISDEQLRALYEKALCLAFPSTTEGFGLPPLEAMTLGCPALVAPCGALPEVCGQAADYVDPHAPSAWAAAIERLLKDPSRHAAMAVASRDHAAGFTWRRAALQLAQELRHVSDVNR